jgi:hypothetical protein
MRRLIALAVMIIAAITVAGCGGSSGSNDKDQISRVVVAWSQAFANGKGDVACRLMTNNAARHLVTRYGGCSATVRAAASSAGGPTDAQFRNIKVNSIRISGHQALVAIVGGVHPYLVVKRGGSWYVDHVVGR